jgi:phosphate:Na+ symporter
MRNAASIGDDVGALPDGPRHEAPVDAQAMVQLEGCAKTLGELQPAYRRATLGSVASGALSADDAIARVDRFRWLEALARHAWRSAAYLMCRPPPP